MAAGKEFTLKELQNWMQGMLVQHVPIAEQPNGKPAGIEQFVRPSKRLSAVRHLNIYRHSYIARLRACMQNQFAALEFALGSELFQQFADQYLDAFPSESYTLNTLGKHFAAFLESTRPDALQEEKESWPDFMIGLAAFEYSLSVIFDEQAEEELPNASSDTPDALLKLVPVFHLFSHKFPVCNYYIQFNQKKNPELPFPEQSFCAVTRVNYKLGLFDIKPAQYYFLELMKKGCTVEEAKNQLAAMFNFERQRVDEVWIEWKEKFIASKFFCIKKG